jgi:hypothetical protein
MISEKLQGIKERLANSPGDVKREDLEWLVKRIEQLESENEWLKKELRYLDYQGETEL